MGIRYAAAARTETGPVRRNNEDCCGFDPDAGIFAVCDGMGGQAAGEVASRLALETILGRYPDFLRQLAGEDRESEEFSSQGSALRASLDEANIKVFEEGCRREDYCGMGTTAVAAAVRDEWVSIGHVGDSRGYLIREGRIHALTEDHSLVASYLRSGRMSAEEAAGSRLQNVLLRALGAEPQVEADILEFAAQNGDILLLCSDGLSKPLDNATLLRIVTETPEIDAACSRLVESAVTSGGLDNVTVILIQVSGT